MRTITEIVADLTAHDDPLMLEAAECIEQLAEAGRWHTFAEKVPDFQLPLLVMTKNHVLTRAALFEDGLTSGVLHSVDYRPDANHDLPIDQCAMWAYMPLGRFTAARLAGMTEEDREKELVHGKLVARMTMVDGKPVITEVYGEDGECSTHG